MSNTTSVNIVESFLATENGGFGWGGVTNISPSLYTVCSSDFIPVQSPSGLAPAIADTYGCLKCLQLRTAPATVPKPGFYGFCGTCGGALSKLVCGALLDALNTRLNSYQCQEPIRPGERFCASCGNDNTLFQLSWNMITDEKLLAELGARGNAEDDDSPFRGVREA